jgi:hypothetical protein
MAGADTDHAIAWPRRGASDVRRQWYQILGMTNKAGAHELDHVDDVDTLYRRTKATREPERLAGVEADRARARPRRGEGAGRRRLNQHGTKWRYVKILIINILIRSMIKKVLQVQKSGYNEAWLRVACIFRNA